MEKDYPQFRIHTPNKDELKLENIQRPVLEKLSNAGFGIKVAEDIFMDMPCILKNTIFPLEIYHCSSGSDTPSVFKVFKNWKEVAEFANSIVE